MAFEPKTFQKEQWQPGTFTPEKAPRKKGPGFLGTLQRPDGMVSTELSIGVGFDGVETEIPSLVPTLTPEEVTHMLSGADPTPAIVDKAVAYARQRMAQGRDVFASADDRIAFVHRGRSKDALVEELVKRPERVSGIYNDTGLPINDINRMLIVSENEWTEPNPNQAEHRIRKMAEVLGRKSVGEIAAQDVGVVDILSLLPFSPLYDYKKKQYSEAKRRLEAGKFVAGDKPVFDVSMPGGFLTFSITDTKKELEKTVLDYKVQQARGKTTPAHIVTGISQLPAYITEFAVLGGGTKVAQAPTAARKVLAALRSAGILTAAQPHRIQSSLIDQMEKGRGGPTAVAMAIGDVYIENISELTGEAFGSVGRSILTKLPFGGRLLAGMQEYAAKIGMSDNAFWKTISTKAGYAGLVNEWGEERMGTILRGAVGVDDFGAGPDAPFYERIAAGLKQDLELRNQIVELAILATPAGVKMVGKAISNLPLYDTTIDQSMQELEKELSKPPPEAEAAPTEAPVTPTAAPTPAVEPITLAEPTPTTPEGEIVAPARERTSEVIQEEIDGLEDEWIAKYGEDAPFDVDAQIEGTSPIPAEELAKMNALLTERDLADKPRRDRVRSIVFGAFEDAGVSEDIATAAARDFYGVDRADIAGAEGVSTAFMATVSKKTLDNPQKAAKELAEFLLFQEEAKQGRDAEGMLGPRSGLTEEGKRDLLKKYADKAIRIIETVQRQAFAKTVEAEPTPTTPEGEIGAPVEAKAALETAQQSKEPWKLPDDIQDAATREADRLVPLGNEAEIVIDSTLQDFTDNDLQDQLKTEERAVDAIERQFDDDTSLVYDLDFRRKLAAAQQKLTSIEMESYRRWVESLHPEGLAQEVRDLTNQYFDKQKTRTLLLMQAIKNQGIEGEFAAEIQKIKDKGHDEKFIMEGKLSDIAKVLKEAGEIEGVPAKIKALLPEPSLSAEVTKKAEPVKLGQAAPEIKAPAEKPPVPPAVPPKAEGELPEPKDPAKKLLAAIKKAKRTIPTVKAEQRTELRKRVGRAAGTARSLIDKGVPAREALRRSTGNLAGPLTYYEQRYESIRDVLGEETVEALHRKIATDPKLQYFEKISLGNWLEKLIDGQSLTLTQARRLGKYFGPDIGNLAMKRVPLQDKFWLTFLEALNVPRTLMASIDQSGIMRQGRAIAGAFPETFAPFVAKYGKAFASEDFAVQLDAAIKAEPLYDDAKHVDLELPEWGRIDIELTERAEEFMGAGLRVVQWIPGVRASERSFVTALNWLRLTVYGKVIQQAELAKGRELTVPEKRHIAHNINNFSGRSRLPQGLKGLAPILNAAFFSPRFMISRFAPLWDIPTAAARSIAEPTVSDTGKLGAKFRLEMQPELKLGIRAIGSLAATNIAAMALLGLVWPDDDDELEMEADPRATDFGKIKHKNFRIDPWSGYIQATRFLARFATGETKLADGTIREIDRWQVFRDFVTTKESPIASLLHDWWVGENMIGKPFGAVKKDGLLDKTLLPEKLSGPMQEIWDRSAPLVIQDAVDAFADAGVWQGMIAFGLAFTGVGVQTYKPSGFAIAKQKKNELAKTAYGDKWDDLKPSQQNKLRRDNSQIEEWDREAKKSAYPLTHLDLTQQSRTAERIHDSLSSPAQAALEEQGIKTGIGRTILSDFFLNEKRAKAYEEMAGKEIEKLVSSLIKRRKWPTYTNIKKEKALQDTVNAARKRAREELLRQIEYGDF